MEPFKNYFNPTVIGSAARHFQRAFPDFDSARFVAEATDGLEALELKARSNHIAAVLARHLPDDFSRAVDVILASLREPSDPDASASSTTDDSGIGGFMVMAICETVVLRGMAHHTDAMRAFHGLTQRFSAEFSIRPFLLEYPDKTLKVLQRWVTDPSAHVRRLVSEGTRPRLPWGVRLQPFVVDPTPTIALLEQLKDDPSEYVRRSVANHLGDIAKDHPQRAVDVASRWMDPTAPRRVKLVKHGLRWLIKQGDGGALGVLGFGTAAVRATIAVDCAVASVGGSLQLNAVVVSQSTDTQPLLIDYAVHHVKANGKRTPKVFKWTVVTLGPGESVDLTKKHSLKPVTTRRYYPGAHAVELLINGVPTAQVEFELSL